MAQPLFSPVRFMSKRYIQEPSIDEKSKYYFISTWTGAQFLSAEFSCKNKIGEKVKANSKGLHECFPPHYTPKSHPLSCHTGPEREAIKSMVGYAFEEEKKDGEIPRGGSSSAYLFLLHEIEEKTAWRFRTLPLWNVDQLISWNLPNLMNKSSLGESKDQERRGEMECPFPLNIFSPKCGPWTSSIIIYW